MTTSQEQIKLEFAKGMLLLKGHVDSWANEFDLTWDQRVEQWVAAGSSYRDIMIKTHRNGFIVNDAARGYKRCDLDLVKAIQPRNHQSMAMQKWIDSGLRGSVSMPTGAGKTIFAVMAMSHAERPTLIVVPTIDLMQQWLQVLQGYFQKPIGCLGGGEHNIQTITIATYDSAALHIERIGNLFGMLIFDEVHHLPAPHYQLIALGSIAPFRLGLSATLERSDGGEEFIFEQVGPLIFESQVQDLVADVLAPYEVETVRVPLTESEMEAYEQARQVYKTFIRKHHVMFDKPGGWQDFLRKIARYPDGAKAFAAYRKQKNIAMAASGKLQVMWDILQSHAGERCIIFTHDNEMAYRIGEYFLAPVLTHMTKLAERRLMLESFRSGRLKLLITSRVLNEGVDVPEASIAIVASGTGTVREHVQRLGRILRARPGKTAKLFELVAKDTAEESTNRRRKRHHAYQESH